MRLPVKIAAARPIVPQRDWVELDRRRLRKQYDFGSRDARLSFIVQLLATNDQAGERFKLLIDGDVVTVGIEASEGEFIGDRDKKSARYADGVYRDVITYSRTSG